MSPTDRLRETLTHLHHELDAVSTADPEVRAMLSQTLRELTEKLEAQRGGDLAPAEDWFVNAETIDQLRASARQFEVDHPAVATAIQSVVDALARMGI